MNKKELRNKFRESVLKRDGYKCKKCSTPGSYFGTRLDAHHICDRSIMPNGGYVVSNGVTLCDKDGGCHMKAEAFYMGKEVEIGFTPDELYLLIGSSYEQAVQDSEALIID